MGDLIVEIRERVLNRRREILSFLEELVSINSYPENLQTGATVNCHHRRPAGCPMEGTEELYAMVSEAAHDLGQELKKERRGGTSDANFLVDGGVPTLDGMGPSGALDHSSDECIIRDSLFERIELLALLMAKQFKIQEGP